MVYEQAPRMGIHAAETPQQEVRWSPRERFYFETVYRVTGVLGPTIEGRFEQKLDEVLEQESDLLDYESNPNVGKGCRQAATRWLTNHPASENAVILHKDGLHAPFDIHVAFLLETGAVNWLNQREETKATEVEAFLQRRKITIIRGLEQLYRDGEVEFTAAREIVMELLSQIAISNKRRREIAEQWGISLQEE